MLKKLKSFFKKTKAYNGLSSHNHEENTLAQLENFETSELNLIESFISVCRASGKDFMVQRPHIIALSLRQSVEELWTVVQEQSYTYYPVYEENLDDIKGWVHIRDFAQLRLKSSDATLHSILHNILFIPFTVPIIDILMKMNHSSIPIAIMVDEHGGTDGLLTLDTILENILDDTLATDDEDIEEMYFEREDENTIIVKGAYLLEDLVKETGIILSYDEENEDLDTVNGLIQYLAGRVPDRTEIISHSNDFEFEILEASPRAVLKVKVIKLVK